MALKNAPAQTEATETVVRSTAEREEAPREREPNFGGPRLKLSVRGAIPGYHLYFENDDDDGAIEELLAEGFTFVTKEEVRLSSHVIQDDDPTSRVSRYVGKKADGSPMRAYLMKCPDEVWAERQRYRAEIAQQHDDTIRRRVEDPEPGRYNPRGFNSQINTRFRKEY